MAMTRKQAEEKITKLYGKQKYFNGVETAKILDKLPNFVSSLKNRGKLTVEWNGERYLYPRETIIKRLTTDHRRGRKIKGV